MNLSNDDFQFTVSRFERFGAGLISHRSLTMTANVESPDRTLYLIRWLLVLCMN